MGKRRVLRRVVVVTGTRAEYGLLVPVMEAIEGQRGLKLQVMVTGMHLLRRFGYTVKEVEQDGWRIDSRVRLQGEADEVIGQSLGLGRAISKMAREFERLKSDIVLVLGDRIEAFAAASTATASQLLLAHIHGGDVAVGVQDDAYRHSISKLAHIHFAATAGARKRLLRLGEASRRIYQVGSPALDGLSELVCTNQKELSEWAGIDAKEDFLLVMQHPSGGTVSQETKWMEETLGGCGQTGMKMVVLYPNCDPGFSGILKVSDLFCRNNGYRLIRHVPRSIYLGLLKRCRALVGNSSSGLIEASRLNVSVINVGPRQMGRERGRNVVDVDYDRKAIARAVANACRSKKRKGRLLQGAGSIYGSGHSGREIASVLARVEIDQSLRQKRIAY